MPLPLPNLDTRRWADLLAEGQAQIPRYAPAWTDHNVQNPGIMLLELLAWQAEQGIYRANRVSERARRSFLDLVGYPPLAAIPARTVVCCPSGPSLLPTGLMLEATINDGRRLPFRTLADLTPTGANVIALLRDDGAQIGDMTRAWRAGRPVAAFGPNPQPVARSHRVTAGETTLGIAGAYAAVAETISATNHLQSVALPLAPGRVLQIPSATALYLGLDRPLPAGAQLCVWVGLADERLTPAQRIRWHDEQAAQIAACRRPALSARPIPPLPPDPWDADPPEVKPALTATDQIRHHGPQLAWEFFDATEQRWRAFGPGDVADETEGLVFAGMLRLRLPTPLGQTTVGGALAYFLRCRMAGQYDTAPLIGSLLLDAVPVEQSEFYVNTKLGQANGLPLQRLPLPGGFVAGGSIQVRLISADEDLIWEQCANLARAGRADRAFVLDQDNSAILFGDGERGQVAPNGAQVVARYLATAGAAGAITAGAPWRLSMQHELANRELLGWEDADLPNLAIRGPLPSTVGASPETIDSAAVRVVADQFAHERLVEVAAGAATLDQSDRVAVLACTPPARAMTLLDCERLALDTPGAAIARARAWANIDPRYPNLNALGSIALAIVPELPLGRPQPSPGLLHAVRRYLERRWVLGTRLVVVGPTYVSVGVSATIRLLPGADPTRVYVSALAAIDEFIDPLRGGPNKRGWPFGRDVYRADIMALIDQVPGVDYIQSLELRADGGAAQCGNLCIGPLALTSPGSHSIEVIS